MMKVLLLVSLLLAIVGYLNPFVSAQLVNIGENCPLCKCNCASGSYPLKTSAAVVCQCVKCPPGTYRIADASSSNPSLYCSVATGPSLVVKSATALPIAVDSGYCSYWEGSFSDYYSTHLVDNNYVIYNSAVIDIKKAFTESEQYGGFRFSRLGQKKCPSLKTVIYPTPTTKLPANTNRFSVNATRQGYAYFTLQVINDGNLPMNVTGTVPSFVTATDTSDNTASSSVEVVPAGGALSLLMQIDVGLIPSSLTSGNSTSFTFTIVAYSYWSMKPVDGTEPSGSFSITVDINFVAATLLIVPNQLNEKITAGEVITRPVTLVNVDSLNGLSFNIAIASAGVNETLPASSWLSVAPNTGSLLKVCGNDQDKFTKIVNLEIDASDLDPGYYSGRLSIAAPPNTYEVQVAITVEAGDVSPYHTTVSLGGGEITDVTPNANVGELYKISFQTNDKYGHESYRYPEGSADLAFLVHWSFNGDCPFESIDCEGDVFAYKFQGFEAAVLFPANGTYTLEYFYYNESDFVPIKDNIHRNFLVLPIDCVSRDANSVTVFPAGATCKCQDGYGYKSGVCTMCEVDYYSSNSACLPCPDGYRAKNPGVTKCDCKPERMIEGDKCVTCPTGGFCKDRTKDGILPLAGYWQVPWNKTSFTKCRDADACPGVKINSDAELYDDSIVEERVNNYTKTLDQRMEESKYSDLETQLCEGAQICNTGYTGPLCVNCEVSYTRIGSYACTRCFDQSVMLALLSLGAILALLFVVFTIRRSIMRTQLSNDIMIIKILLSHLQLVAMCISFKLGWPVWLQSMYSVFSTIGSAAQTLISVDCLANPSTTNTCLTQTANSSSSFAETGMFDSSRITPFFYEALILALIPIIWLLATGIFWFGSYMKHRKEGRRKGRSSFNYFVVSNIVLLFFLYPTLSINSLKFFSCSPENLGIRFLEADFNIVCFGKMHRNWLLLLGIWMVILYALGIPAVSLYMLRHHVHHKTKYKETFSFIYEGFKENCYYWEVVIMIRKLLFAMIGVLLQTVGAQVQAYIGLLVLMGSLLLQTHYKPYEDEKYNFAEWLGLFVACLTLYIGLFVTTDAINSEPTAATFLAALIVVANCIFLLYILRLLYQASDSLKNTAIGMITGKSSRSTKESSAQLVEHTPESAMIHASGLSVSNPHASFRGEAFTYSMKELPTAKPV